MAPVLARLVRLLAMLCLAAGASIVLHGCVWAMLAFTDVRTHGVAAVTHPESVVALESDAVRADGRNAVVSVRADDGEGASDPAVVDEALAATAESAPEPASADGWLSFAAGLATIVGVSSLVLLPVLLSVAFMTALVAAPRAAGATMGGVLWSIALLALVLPWNALWPQVPWAGLFQAYGALVADVELVRETGAVFGAATLATRVVLPALAIAVLVGVAWRCGEPLHAELLAAEALLVDASIEEDAATTAKKASFQRSGRAAAGLSRATQPGASGPIPMVGATSDAAPDAPIEDEPRPRRLV